jgi:YidC/Oxa1 family membrane protein insertase
MILAFNPADIIQIPFGWLISLLYQLTTNYGLALILFTIIVKLIMFPATAKSKKSTMKMSRLQPRLEVLKKKYAGDDQKLGEAMRALYKEEGVSMGGGCLWSLIPLLIIFPLYTVVREPITYILMESAEVAGQIVNEIKNLVPDLINDKNTFYQQMLAVPYINDFAEQLKAAIPAIKDTTLQGMDFTFLGINLGITPDINIFAWKVYDWSNIGAFLLPLASAGSQVLSMMISQRMNNSLITNEKGIQDKEMAKNSQANQTSKTMMWMMPIMSLWIGFTVPCALSLYWLVQGLVAVVVDVYLTKKYRKIYDAEDAERLKKALAEEALEAEKERIRAERRAANPDGITENTSKKKLQQKQQKQQEEAKAAAAKEYAVKKGTWEEHPKEEKVALSGIAERPFCKGRAYDPNRYASETTEE